MAKEKKVLTAEEKEAAKKKAAAAKAAKAEAEGKASVNDAKAMIDLTVTQEYLDAHPEMVEDGIAVGDVIQVEDETAGKTAPTGKAPKKDEPVAVVKDTEFIRCYPASTPKEDVEGFVNKDAGRRMIGADSIDSLVVEYDEQKADPNAPGSKITFIKKEVFNRGSHGEDMFKAAAARKAEKRGTILFY